MKLLYGIILLGLIVSNILMYIKYNNTQNAYNKVNEQIIGLRSEYKDFYDNAVKCSNSKECNLNLLHWDRVYTGTVVEYLHGESIDLCNTLKLDSGELIILECNINNAIPAYQYISYFPNTIDRSKLEGIKVSVYSRTFMILKNNFIINIVI